MNNIPPLDLTRQYQQIKEEVNTAVLEVMRSGRYIGGANVTDFEHTFAAYVGTQTCIACNSGTDALALALRALGIGPGDEVITSPFTFIATAEVVNLVGATPVFVDINPTTFNLDLEKVPEAITPKTKAIIPVHLFGCPVDMTSLKEIAKSYSLAIIEDCAQATGAQWQGQKVGSFGTIGCFSFFPTKNLGAFGDGGAITTNNLELAATVKMLREHGQKERYLHEVIGINSRLDAIQAVILSVKLRYLDHWNEKREHLAHTYQELLENLPDITPPQIPHQGRSSWNQYTIRIADPDQENRRDRLRQQLQEMGISSMVYYPIPLHLQPVYQNLNYLPGHFPQAEQASREVLSLPLFPELTTEEQERVVNALKESLKKVK